METKEERSQNNGGMKVELENKRKRRCSTLSDESPKRKTFITNGDEAVAGEDELQINTDGQDNIEIQSKFLLEELCDEVLYEIFKYVDTWSLMALRNVSRRLQKFVLDKRLWEKIDLCKAPLPLGILEDMLEQSHEKTTCVKLKGPSPSQHVEGEIKQFNQTIRKSFTTRCIELVTLELYEVTLDFKQISLNDFPLTIKRLVLNNCNVRADNDKSLFSGIDTLLINLEEVAIENSTWFDPYYVMPLSKLRSLRYLSLRGCSQMQEFIPYGSIAARHGFKRLEILDLRDTPLSDSDLQCFNAIETLKEIYLQCPQDEHTEESLKFSSFSTDAEKNTERENQSTSSKLSVNTETPSTSRGAGKKDLLLEKSDDEFVTQTSLTMNDCESPTSSSSSSSSSPSSISIAPNNEELNSTPQSCNVTQNLIPLVGTNSPSRSRFLPRPDHIFYLDVRNRTSPNAVHFNIRDNMRVSGQAQQYNQHAPPPVIEQMMRHSLFWHIVNPLGGVAGVGGQDYLNVFSLSSSHRLQSRSTISDRGICCFGRTRQPVQQGVIWIRFNNRPFENRFERFSVRDYKFVTDVSLQHLVQCSPHLIFLDVSGTSVTLDGLQRFKERKPECEVVAEHLLDVMQNEAIVS